MHPEDAAWLAGAPANEAHGESRGRSWSSEGARPYRAWPDLAAMVTVEEPSRQRDILEIIEQAARGAEASHPMVLTRVFGQCEPLLGANGELLVLWLHGAEGYLLFNGSTARVLLVRAGEVREIGPGDERSRSASPTLCVLEVGEGDTFLLLSEVTMVKAVFEHVCSHHRVRVEPLHVGEDETLSKRVAAVRAIAEELVADRVGLEVQISVEPSWDRTPRLDVMILRGDVDGAADEDAAAGEVRAALARADRELARTVSVRGDYIK